MFTYQYCEILKNTYFEELLQTVASTASLFVFLFISFSPSKRESSFPGMVPLFDKKDLMVLEKNLSLLDVLDTYF